MNGNLKDILSKSGSPSPETIKKYLNHELSAEEIHEVEKAMADDPLLSEAIEGLEGLSSYQIQQTVSGLDKAFSTHISKKLRKKHKHPAGSQSAIYFAILLILLLCFIAYYIIRKF